MRRRRLKDVADRRAARGYPVLTAPRPHEVNYVDQAHGIELQVQHELLTEPRFHFSSLVIHRIANGVCLEGIVEMDDEAPDVCVVAQRVSGVDVVLNHLLIHELCALPAKG